MSTCMHSSYPLRTLDREPAGGDKARLRWATAQKICKVREWEEREMRRVSLRGATVGEFPIAVRLGNAPSGPDRSLTIHTKNCYRETGGVGYCKGNDPGKWGKHSGKRVARKFYITGGSGCRILRGANTVDPPPSKTIKALPYFSAADAAVE